MADEDTKTSTLKKAINFCSERPFTAVISYILVVSVIFLIFPRLDIWLPASSTPETATFRFPEIRSGMMCGTSVSTSSNGSPHCRCL